MTTQNKINKLLSIIIVTYNSEQDIFDCLASIYQFNDIGSQLEIIIVDNNSSAFDVTQAKINQLYPFITILHNRNNGGYGQGNNIGIKVASAPIVAIMNPDVRLITPIFQAIINNFSDEHVGLLGARQMQNPTKAAASFHFIPNATGFEKFFGSMICNRLGWYCKNRMYLSGAFFFVRKSLMEAIGGFDEKIFLYAEENDIRFRILQFDPTTKIVYRHDLHYIHPTDQRPYSETTVLRMIASDTYVLQKQGIIAKRYFHTEIAKRYWSILILALQGNKRAIIDTKKQIRLLCNQLSAL